MSVFEELIDELKEENLLEETVLATSRAAAVVPAPDPQPSQILEVASEFAELADAGHDADFPEQPADEREAHRRRAMDEVSSLQMVEHVISGIEREHMKMSPQAFDDLDVKKALHKYLQVNAPINSDEHSEAELELLQETEKWFSALSRRDSNISVANVRRFCENSRPVLSSQALMALGRFYRNSPYSEAVRGKFDFVMTKLFSRDVGEEKRRLLFGRIEMLGHIKTLYSNWASLSIAPDGEGDGTSILTSSVVGFDEFLKECQSSASFDALVTSDFFNRIRLFKEAAAELFFEPPVIAAAMECNVGIGNRFVDLVQVEREISGESSLKEKYGYTYDTIISGAASKTLLLLDLLREARESTPVEAVVADSPVHEVPRVTSFERAPVVAEPRVPFVVNKWLVAATLVILVLSAVVYFWSENATTVNAGVEVSSSLDVSSSDLKQHLLEASTSNETFYGVMQPTWDALSEDEQKQFLAKALEFAKSKGLKKVNLLNGRGRTVGYATAERSQLFGPQ
ncbi:MAG: hypothetical protein ABL984_12445 [Pyrinomonadaceae bacterium]